MSRIELQLQLIFSKSLEDTSTSVWHNMTPSQCRTLLLVCLRKRLMIAKNDGSFSEGIRQRKIRSYTYKMLMDIKLVSREFQSWLCKQSTMQTAVSALYVRYSQ